MVGAPLGRVSEPDSAAPHVIARRVVAPHVIARRGEAPTKQSPGNRAGDCFVAPLLAMTKGNFQMLGVTEMITDL